MLVPTGRAMPRGCASRTRERMTALRIGLIARADARGLAVQTEEIWRHLHPTRTVVVDMGSRNPYPCRPERFPGARVVAENELGPAVWEWLCDGADLILTAETPYDYGLYDLARSRGVSTVCHVNPEFWRYATEPGLAEPTRMFAPSRWLLERMPGVGLLPMPVALDRLQPRLRTQVRTFLHVGGHPAMSDRNGTRLLLNALHYLGSECRVIITSQQPIRVPVRIPRHVEVEFRIGNRENYAAIYDEADALVLTRRYGGLCLPILEALGSGMPVIAADRVPEVDWVSRETLVPVRSGGYIRTQFGRIGLETCDPRQIANGMDVLAGDDYRARECSAASLATGQRMSWDAMLPLWDAQLGKVVKLPEEVVHG